MGVLGLFLVFFFRGTGGEIVSVCAGIFFWGVKEVPLSYSFKVVLEKTALFSLSGEFLTLYK